MTTLERQVRLLDVARAFAIIAKHPSETLDVALEVVDDQTINVIEMKFGQIAPRLNGLGNEIQALMDHPFDASPAALNPIKAPASAADGFDWKKIGKRGATDTRFECDFAGHKLAVQKNGPAQYEGFIDGRPVNRGKFKSDVRLKVEKEATKFAA